MDKRLFVEIIDKFLKGRTNLEEEGMLFKHYETLQKKGQEWNDKEHGNYTEVRTTIYERIKEEINTKEKSLFKNRWVRGAIAACACILIASSISFYLNSNNVLTNKVAANQLIKPGSNEAILTLQDGSKIVLTKADIGEVAQQNGIQITKAADGQLVYTITRSHNDNIQSSSYNTIETPKGGQYQINLPDGSKVWLNAASSLKYPTGFNGKERKVELTGEGYFEIAKDKAHPFKVITQNQQVEVLGTHFNVNAYNDEGNTKTTLLEGSVKAGLVNSSEFITLKPGQQMVLNQQKINVVEVDTEEAIAWKNGYFMFNNESLETIMNKIARWYNVDIEYNGNNINKKFGGSISRFKDVNDVLDMLELTGSVHFKLEGRRVIVMP